MSQVMFFWLCVAISQCCNQTWNKVTFRSGLNGIASNLHNWLQYLSCTRPTCWEYEIVEHSNAHFFLQQVSSCLLTVCSVSSLSNVGVLQMFLIGSAAIPVNYLKCLNTFQTNSIHVISCNKNANQTKD